MLRSGSASYDVAPQNNNKAIVEEFKSLFAQVRVCAYGFHGLLVDDSATD